MHALQCRYHHVQGAIHITPAGMLKLTSRPWHYKLMPNPQHHGMLHYRTSVALHLPAFMEANPTLKLADKAAEAGDQFMNVSKLHELLCCQGIGDVACDAGTEVEDLTQKTGSRSTLSFLMCVG